MLKTAEFFMNNIVQRNNVLPHWHEKNTDTKKIKVRILKFQNY